MAAAQGFGPVLWLCIACTAADPAAPCGPASARVLRVVDGDTIVLESAERVRYLLVDTPEVSGTAECFGQPALSFNQSLVEARDVALAYDAECRDRYGRLLAYVSVDGLDVGRRLIELGYGCVFFIPPLGADRVDELLAIEQQARAAKRGLWGACPVSICD